jgi:hypothetical protein
LTIFGTPGGTPLNQTGGFQGTQPGNPVQNTLSPINPGVGLFPPNSNNQSGDTILASVSRGGMPQNALATNFGIKDSRPGRSVLECKCGESSTGTAYNLAGGSQHSQASGGNSLGAGGLNQTPGPGSGTSNILPENSPSNQVTVTATPVYQG